MAAVEDDLPRLQELKLEHDPATPDLMTESESATPNESSSNEASTSKNADGFIFGAATRLGGRILTADRDPACLVQTIYVSQNMLRRSFYAPLLLLCSLYSGRITPGTLTLPFAARSLYLSPLVVCYQQGQCRMG